MTSTDNMRLTWDHTNLSGWEVRLTRIGFEFYDR